MKISIIGDSKRLNMLEKNLNAAGFEIYSYKTCTELPQEIDSEIVVLPVPTLNKDGNINLDKGISTVKLLSAINEKSLIISCGFSVENYHIIDLNNREDFAYLNAVPTAEGAIYFALNNMEKSLFESRILITGFGRVAKILADRLKGLCNDITICARSLKDLSYADSLGYKTISLKQIQSEISDYDIVFQTVPAKIITKKVIGAMNKNTLIIELSSRSVGTDYEYATKRDIVVVHAPALPEKIAPITAGNILTKSVISIIAEQNFSE